MVDLDKYKPVENIGLKERRRRLSFGIAMMVVAGFLLVITLLLDFNRFWRLILFVPFLMACLGIFQYKEKTWVALAAQGWANFDQGNIRIEDENWLKKIRERSRKVGLHAFLTAVILTALSLALPS